RGTVRSMPAGARDHRPAPSIAAHAIGGSSGLLVAGADQGPHQRGPVGSRLSGPHRRMAPAALPRPARRQAGKSCVTSRFLARRRRSRKRTLARVTFGALVSRSRIEWEKSTRLPKSIAMTAPFFSVVIPTKNRSFLVGGAISSVLRQSFPDFGLVVVDNDDTDATQKVVASFDDPRVRHVRTGGLSMPDNWEAACAAGV